MGQRWHLGAAVGVGLAVTLSSCFYGDPIPKAPHGIARSEDGGLQAVSCESDGGIEEVEMVEGGAEPKEWDETILDLKSGDSDWLRSRVPLDVDTAGYSLRRQDDLGYVRITVFTLRDGNALGTVWDIDLRNVEPGEVATRDGIVAEQAWKRVCEK